VEKATVRLKSLIKRPKNPQKTLKKAVTTTPRKDKMNTPATTIVEECNKLDTGVGLSMALGSQLLKSVNEDLVKMAALTKKESSQTSHKKSLTRLIKKAIIDLF
jgi:hypothetical protein